MLEVVMGLLAAVDVSAVGNLLESGWRIAGDSQVGDLLARPRAYRLTEVVTEAGFRISNLIEVVPGAGWRVPG
jgi:hypothetical protein